MAELIETKIDSLDMRYHELAREFIAFKQFSIQQINFFRTALLALDMIEDDGTQSGRVQFKEEYIKKLEAKGVVIERQPNTMVSPPKPMNSKKSFPPPNKKQNP